MIKKLQNLTIKELKNEFISYNELINNTGCYGKNDVQRYYDLLGELDRRGIEFETRTVIVFYSV